MSAAAVSAIGGTTTIVGILGWPVAHSLSPRMQNAAFAAAGLDWAYVPLPTPPELLADAVRGLVAAGFAGANVTVPHKTAALELCDEVDDVAAGAGSVNTLVVHDGRVHGSSTDVTAIDALVEARGRRVLVLGAGGAARAVLASLDRRGADVTVASRREPGWPPASEGYDVLVNTTPVKDELLVAPRGGQLVVDLAYRPDGADTALVAAARAAGCEVVDGLEILVAQGAGSFERWTGRRPPVDVMRRAIRP